MRTHLVTFHADLRDAPPELCYLVSVNGKKYPLTEHTEASRRKAKAENERLGRLVDECLTHYTKEPVPAPDDAAIRVHIAYRKADGSLPDKPPFAGHAATYIPPSSEGLAAGAGPLHTHIDWISTAKTLLFHHADLATRNKEVADWVHEHMDEDKARATYDLIVNLATKMRIAGPPAADSGWARLVPVKKGDTTYYIHNPSPEILAEAGPAMTALMISTKNDVRLKDKKWQQAAGVSTQNAVTPAQLLATIRAEGGDNWSASLSQDYAAHGLQTEIAVKDPTKRKITVNMSNTYIRYLAAYIQFRDAAGKAMKTPDWKPDEGTTFWVDELKLQYPDFRFLGTIQPIDAIYAVPNFLNPGRLVGNGEGYGVTVSFPEGAVTAGIYGCGLGTGANKYPASSTYGGVMTVASNLLVPAFFMAFAVAAASYKGLYKVLTDNKVIAAAITLGVLYFGGTFTYSAVEKRPDWSVLTSLGKILFEKGFGAFLTWMEAELAEEEIEDQIPFAGWIVATINISMGLAQIAETIVEVATSPWEIPNTIHTQITSTVTIKPDPVHGTFPQPPSNSAASCTVKMIYKNTKPATAHTVDVSGTRDKLETQFVNPLGGEIKFEAEFYTGDFVAAKATTEWMPNNEKNTAQVTLVLVQRAIPLTSKSVYKHTARLTYRDGAYGWTQTEKAPTATVDNLNPATTGNAISELNGLTLSQRHAMLGFAWKAAGMGVNACVGGPGDQQLHAFMNIDIPGVPMDAVKFPSCVFVGRSNIAYDPYPPKFLMKDGQWVLDNNKNPVPDPASKDLGAYYVDPRKAELDPEKGGGYHLRAITLDKTTPFDTGDDLKSWGRFPYAPDSLVIHPSGHVVGVSQQYKKIMVLQLPASEAADDALPLARVYAGKGMNYNNSNGRAGLLVEPVAAGSSYDGTVLILEYLVNESITLARIQAFDINGNPVYCFADDKGKPSPFLPLPTAGRTYLDLAVVGDKKQTYMYVLYYEGTGKLATDYHMSIYQYGVPAPKANPLVTTNNLAAAKLAADMWHTLYALNYEMTTDGAGHPAGPTGTGTGPAGRTAPSVSEWLPPLPSAPARKRK